MKSKNPNEDSRFVKGNAFRTSLNKLIVKYFCFCLLLCVISVATVWVSYAANPLELIYGEIRVVRKPPSADWVEAPPKREKGTTTTHKWRRDLEDTLIIKVCGKPEALKVVSAQRRFADTLDEETIIKSDFAYCFSGERKDIHTPLGKKRKGGKKIPGKTITEKSKSYSSLFSGLGESPVKDGVKVTLSFDVVKYKLAVRCENLISNLTTSETKSSDPCTGRTETQTHIRKTGEIGEKYQHRCTLEPPGEDPGVIKLEKCETIVEPKPIPISFEVKRRWGAGSPITNKDDVDKKVKSSGAGPTAEDTFATWDLRWGSCPYKNP